MNNTQTKMANETYNGWANYETWNASLWINNDEFLYNTAKACVEYCGDNETPYDKFIRCQFNVANFTTGDGVEWDDNNIDKNEMNDCLYELASGW